MDAEHRGANVARRSERERSRRSGGEVAEGVRADRSSHVRRGFGALAERPTEVSEIRVVSDRKPAQAAGCRRTARLPYRRAKRVYRF